MAYFKDIVAAILRDVLAAQDEANLLAESLAEEYRTSPVLRSFPVPTVSVGGMEITLRFAIIGGEGLRPAAEGGESDSLEVIVDADRLAALGKDSLQTITLKVSPAQLAAAKNTDPS